MVKVCASIVVYQADRDVLSALVAALLSQVDLVLIVDNDMKPEGLPCSQHHRVHYLPQRRNIGVSAAHNIAFSRAKREGCSHVVTFDQDSMVPQGFVDGLLSMERSLLDRGIMVGCVGPRFSDPRGGVGAPFIRLAGWKIEKIDCRNWHDRYVRADYLITSGCLISLSTIELVGPFDEGFFIDYVDIEWGLRAVSRGFQNFGVCGVTMSHPIGDAPLVIPLIGKKVPLHSPLRHYYHFRNAVHLYKRPYARTLWVLNDGIRLVIKFFVYSLFAPTPFRHFRMMSLGIWHGIIGVTGPFKG